MYSTESTLIGESFLYEQKEDLWKRELIPNYDPALAMVAAS